MKTLLGGMPAEIAEGIRKLGKQFSMDLIRKTGAMYAGIQRNFDPEEIKVTRDIAYGDDERQRLDVHIRKKEPGPDHADVIMFVHGGGFVFGDRNTRRHIPDYFAAEGFVGVNVTHRLAPEHKWPSGGMDIGAAVAWVHKNISEYGGNPHRIILMGESAGAFHTATYVFRPDVLGREFPEVAGAIMASGPFLVDERIANENEASYYGDNPELWHRVAFPGNFTRTHIPALFTVAEFDPLHIDQGMVLMLYELIVKHGVVPRYRQLPGHNHISGTLSIGTDDGMLAEEVLDFISGLTRRDD